MGERGEAAEDDLRFASPSPWTQGWESIWADLDVLPGYWRTPERAVVTWAEHLWEAGDEAELRAFLAAFVVDDLRLVRVEYAGEGGMIRVSAHYHVEARRP